MIFTCIYGLIKSQDDRGVRQIDRKGPTGQIVTNIRLADDGDVSDFRFQRFNDGRVVSTTTRQD